MPAECAGSVIRMLLQDHFAPLPGFELHYMYDDFSAACFDGWHTEIMGGSWVSTGDLASSFARFHFRRHFFQHLGFRYVFVPEPEPYPGSATVANLWEGMSTVSNGTTNSFTKASERLPYPAELVTSENALAFATNISRLVEKAFVAHADRFGVPATPSPASLACARVLHLGCGVGGVTMELARAGFGKVVGVDNYEPVIRQARVIQHHGQWEYERVEEGVLTKTSIARIAPGVERGRAVFMQDDCANLSADVLAHGPFDVVLVDNLLCLLRQPLELLQHLGDYVRANGLLIIASNNDWDPAVTPRNNWVGGFKMNGEDMNTLHMLKYHLGKTFALLESVDVPKLTRSHARRFVLEILETSVWRRS
jgi:putative 4-mercaptohistidine N1-methyltranferase